MAEKTGEALTAIEQVKQEQMLATMDAMEASGVPNYLVTIGTGQDRIIVLNHPYLYTEEQKPWEEISSRIKSQLDERHARVGNSNWFISQTLEPQDTTWYMHPILHKSGLYAAMILAGFGDYAKKGEEDLQGETDTMAHVRAICILEEEKFRDRLAGLSKKSTMPHIDFYDLVKAETHLPDVKSELDVEGKIHLMDFRGLIEVVRVNNGELILTAIKDSKNAALSELGASEAQRLASRIQVEQTIETAQQIQELF